MMKLLITVPTYWRPREETQPGIYDHPTPVGENGTLPRLLDSLVRADSTVPVVVIVAVTDPAIDTAAADWLHTMIEPYRRKLPIAIFSALEMRCLSSAITDIGCDPWGIGLVGYGRVRNLQLAIGAALGIDVLILLDDDEQVPGDYSARAEKFIGGDYEGAKVLGVAGPYREEDVPVLRNPNPLLERGRWIRSGVDVLGSDDKELAETRIGFGGNMLLHQDLFTQVPFDPQITRGEDIDYITTCLMLGNKFWWDHDLFVYHSAPDSFRRPPCVMLQRDIMRFIYSKEKIKFAIDRGLPAPVDLDPYPGRFMRDDLVQQSVQALREVCPQLEHAQAFVDSAILRARNSVSKYFAFRDGWESVMAKIVAEKSIGDYLRRELLT